MPNSLQVIVQFLDDCKLIYNLKSISCAALQFPNYFRQSLNMFFNIIIIYLYKKNDWKVKFRIIPLDLKP